MKKNGLIILMSLFAVSSNAQYFYDNNYYDSDLLIEASISAGGMNCLTDIGGRRGAGKRFLKDLTLQTTMPCVSVYAHLLYNYTWGIRLEYTRGHIRADDALLRNDNSEGQLRYKRNLHFRSVINEIALIAEWHPLEWIQASQPFGSSKFSPYVLAGLGYFHFNPQAKWKDQWIDLQPLHTEGQGFAAYPERKDYKLKQINLPLGMGLKYDLSAHCLLRFEILHRWLFTDYLDDVSTDYIDPSEFNKYLSPDKSALAYLLSNRQRELDPNALYVANQRRGNPSNNDSYFTCSLKLGIVLNRKRR